MASLPPRASPPYSRRLIVHSMITTSITILCCPFIDSEQRPVDTSAAFLTKLWLADLSIFGKFEGAGAHLCHGRGGLWPLRPACGCLDSPDISGDPGAHSTQYERGTRQPNVRLTTRHQRTDSTRPSQLTSPSPISDKSTTPRTHTNLTHGITTVLMSSSTESPQRDPLTVSKTVEQISIRRRADI